MGGASVTYSISLSFEGCLYWTCQWPIIAASHRILSHLISSPLCAVQVPLTVWPYCRQKYLKIKSHPVACSISRLIDSKVSAHRYLRSDVRNPVRFNQPEAPPAPVKPPRVSRTLAVCKPICQADNIVHRRSTIQCIS